MKSNRLIVAGVACAAAAVVMSISVAQSRAAEMQAGRGSARAVPKFDVDPAWPKIPNGWALVSAQNSACVASVWARVKTAREIGVEL